MYDDIIDDTWNPLSESSQIWLRNYTYEFMVLQSDTLLLESTFDQPSLLYSNPIKWYAGANYAKNLWQLEHFSIIYFHNFQRISNRVTTDARGAAVATKKKSMSCQTPHHPLHEIHHIIRIVRYFFFSMIEKHEWHICTIKSDLKYLDTHTYTQWDRVKTDGRMAWIGVSDAVSLPWTISYYLLLPLRRALDAISHEYSHRKRLQRLDKTVRYASINNITCLFISILQYRFVSVN